MNNGTLVFSLISCIIAIIGSVLGVVTFFKNGKDKSNQETKDESYKWGKFDAKLDNIEKSLGKIEDKLDNYDIEVKQKINEAMEHHINEYHKKG